VRAGGISFARNDTRSSGSPCRRLGWLARRPLLAVARGQQPRDRRHEGHARYGDDEKPAMSAGHGGRRLSFGAMPEHGAQTVVMKFGGTSVADAQRITPRGGRIVQRAEEGQRVVAVLSARGKQTDELVALAHEVSPRPHPREMDMLLSTGERTRVRSPRWSSTTLVERRSRSPARRPAS
jgi:hypothetical protein